MKHYAFIVTLTIITSFSALANDQVTAEKKALIDTLLIQTGQSAVAVGKQFSDAFVQQMVMVLKQSKPDINPKAFDIVEEEVRAVIEKELVAGNALNDMMYPIYSKHFTADELQKMIELNNTELGKKMIQVMPMITQEGMQVGQAFGMQLGPQIQQRIMSRFEKEGIK